MNIRTFTSYFDVNRRMPGFKSVAICACLSRSIYTALRLIKCYAVYLMVAAPSIYHFGWWQSLSTRQPEGFPEGVFQFPANARVEMFVAASARFSLKMWVWVWVNKTHFTCRAMLNLGDSFKIQSILSCAWKTPMVGGFKHLLYFHILGRIIPTDFHIFQTGWNHQPDMDC